MNDKVLEGKVIAEMDREIEEQGYSSPVEVLMALGYLSSGDYREWESGRVSFLEKVLRIGPSKVLDLITVMSSHARKAGYKPKKGDYGKLRFSRTGNEVIEDRFRQHYIDKRWKG